MTGSRGGSGGGGKGRGRAMTGASRRFGGARQMNVRLKTAIGRTPSSQRWLERQLNDPYVAAAKREGWRSRAAFKLIEIDDKYRFLKPGQRVVDLGAAPGGWSQVAAKRTKADEGRGQVVAIDYLGVDPIPGVEIVELDFMADEAPARLKSLLRDGGADIVLSDMAAPTTGHTGTDHLRIMGLAEAALAFAVEVLSPGGAFLCKVFQGGSERDLLVELKKNFKAVRHVKPPASRSDSAELYVLATGFKGRA
ncbi:MAG: RlmE family RNA methyltransferase [Proteobacteria bacterium]|nr:RlmE family RNA methyltransferase [Pseudomonadota bacterium]